MINNKSLKSEMDNFDCSTVFTFTKKVFNSFPFLVNRKKSVMFQIVESADSIRIRCKTRNGLDEIQNFLKVTERVHRMIDDQPDKPLKYLKKGEKAAKQANISLNNGINFLNNMIDQAPHLIIKNTPDSEDKIVNTSSTLSPNFSIENSSKDFCNIAPHILRVSASKNEDFELINEELDEMLSNCGAKPKLYFKSPKATAFTHALGLKYEAFVAEKYRLMGYTVEITPLVHDYGVDLLVTKNDETIALQCKYWESYAGVDAVQEVFTGAAYYNAKQAIVITNNGFTSNAKHLAGKIGVLLIVLPIR